MKYGTTPRRLTIIVGVELLVVLAVFALPLTGGWPHCPQLSTEDRLLHDCGQGLAALAADRGIKLAQEIVRSGYIGASPAERLIHEIDHRCGPDWDRDSVPILRRMSLSIDTNNPQRWAFTASLPSSKSHPQVKTATETLLFRGSRQPNLN
ncbi:MAG TPA: hypothetical protein VMF06_07260 [Candidatus Limnocylindria bacterium]|nr:hypothetical protein [Candidatus Limnocylindria bacterium]